MAFTPSDAFRVVQRRPAEGLEHPSPFESLRHVAQQHEHQQHEQGLDPAQGYVKLGPAHYILQHPTDYAAAFMDWNRNQAQSAWQCDDWIPSLNPRWVYPVVISFVTGDLSKDAAHFTVIELADLESALAKYRESQK